MKELGGRTTEIRDYLLPHMEVCFAESCQVIQTELDMGADKIWDDLKSVLCVVLSRAEDMQKQHRKGGIQYLAFSFLRHSVYLDRLELRIDALDDGFYLDEQEAAGYYQPVFLQDQYLEDLTFLYQKAKGKFIRLQNYEMVEIRKEYTDFYCSFLLRMMESLTELIVEMVKDSGADLAENLKILFGGYMDKAVELWASDSAG